MLTDDAGDRARRRRELQRGAFAIGDVQAFSDRSWQHAAHGLEEGFLAKPPIVPGLELQVAFDDAVKRSQGFRPAHGGRARWRRGE